MPYTIALTSTKGGSGKSTLAFNLAGALTEQHSPVVLIDEDVVVRSCLTWAEAAPAPLPFQVLSPDRAVHAASIANLLITDTEGRPSMPDLEELARRAQRVLIPCGPSGLEIRASVQLWQALKATGGNLAAVQLVINKAPPVGTVGQQARDVLRELGIPVCETVIRLYTAHQRAAEQGQLVRDVQDPRAVSAWADIQALAQEVTA